MSEQSNNQGRAYEYICLTTLYNEISKVRSVEIEQNSAYNAAFHAWSLVSPFFQDVLTESAKSAVATIFDMEPMILEPSNDLLKLKIQTDNQGKDGDVRDIVISRKDVQWEIGLSIKHNHFAVKHSRLAELYNAALKTDKPFIICENEFQGEILKIVTQNTTSSFYDFNRRKIYVYGKNLHGLMAEKGFFFLGRTNNVTQKAIANFPNNLFIYSMWNGYLDKRHPAFDEYKNDFINSAIHGGSKMVYLHTSGHAGIDEIKKVCEITNAKTVIPIHSEKPEMLKELGIKSNIVILQDNEILTI